MRNGMPVVARPDYCLHCGHCSSVCPKDAIRQTAADSEPFQPKLLPTQDSLTHLFRSRRSVRYYKDKPLAKEHLDKILQAGRYTATGSNAQNVRYIVHSDREKISELQKKIAPVLFRLFRLSDRVTSLPLAKRYIGAEYVKKVKEFYMPSMKVFTEKVREGKDRIFYDAPALIIVYAEKFDEAAGFGCAAALYNCSLMAHLLGIGCCFNGFVQLAVNHNSKFKKHLGIPRHMMCYGAMTLGYQDVKFRRLVKRDLPNVRWM